MHKKRQGVIGERRGLLFALSSPSGTGKSTLARMLLKKNKLEHSISATTRAPRPSEKDGQDYHFLSVEQFEKCRDEGRFIEWAQVHDNYYGTFRFTIEEALSQGRDILFDIDYQGVQQLQEQMPQDVVSLFILPPSMHELKRRLVNRAEDSVETIEKRLRNSLKEINYYSIYDYVLVNENLKECFANMETIYHAERLKRSRNPYLEKMIEGFKSYPCA